MGEMYEITDGVIQVNGDTDGILYEDLHEEQTAEDYYNVVTSESSDKTSNTAETSENANTSESVKLEDVQEDTDIDSIVKAQTLLKDQLANQQASLRRLSIVCIVLGVFGIACAITFGVLIGQVMKRDEIPDFKVAFTTANPIGSTSYQPQIFRRVIENIGGHYNVSTGRFVAPFRGVYFFVFHLYLAPSSSVTSVSCWITGNRGRKMYARVYPVGDGNFPYGVYESGQSLVLQLNSGDTMEIGQCSSSNLSSWSSFSGFLVFAF